VDRSARNLLAQMLHKDPHQRPSLARVLAHPFLSGKKVTRLVGEQPKYDVFLSYRVAADGKDTANKHVEKLYTLLTEKGLKVYWDVKCLAPGVDWEQGFCEGLVSSRAFVPLLSRDAINHPTVDWQNFSKLTAGARQDNVFLEHRLAIELQELGLIEKVFPVFIGDCDAASRRYSHYFRSGCHPAALPDVAVAAVEEKLVHHLEAQALGTPLRADRTVSSVVAAVTTCQGAFIEGDGDEAFRAAADVIVAMVADTATAMPPLSHRPSATAQHLSSPRGSGGGGGGGGTHALKALLDAKEAEVATLQVGPCLLSLPFYLARTSPVSNGSKRSAGAAGGRIRVVERRRADGGRRATARREVAGDLAVEEGPCFR